MRSTNDLAMMSNRFLIGIYNRDDLKSYVEILDKLARSAKVGLELELISDRDNIKVLYDKEKNVWNVVSKDSQPIAMQSTDELVEKIFSLFEDDDAIYRTFFGTRFFVRKETQQEMSEFIDALFKEEKIHELHGLKKLTVVSDRGVTRAHILAKLGIVNVLEHVAGFKYRGGKFAIDFNRATSFGITPVYLAAEHGKVGVLKFLATLKNPDGSPRVNFDVKTIDGITLEGIATKNKHQDVLEFLATLKKPDAKEDIQLNAESDVESGSGADIESNPEKKTEEMTPSKNSQETASAGFFSRMGAFFKRHWKAMIIGGVIAAVVATGLTMGLAAPLIVVAVAIGVGAAVGASGGAAFGIFRDRREDKSMASTEVRGGSIASLIKNKLRAKGSNKKVENKIDDDEIPLKDKRSERPKKSSGKKEEPKKDGPKPGPKP